MEKIFLQKNWIALLGVVFFFVGGYFLFIQKDADSNQEKTVFETGQVKRGDILSKVSGAGQVYARSQVNLQPVVAGDAIDVVRVYVKNDEVVQKGDPLLSLDADDAEKSVRNALLSLRAAEIKMKQVERSSESKNTDDRLTRQAQEVSLAQANNALLDAKEKLRDYTIRAPFDGIVTGLSVSAGDSVSRDDVVASLLTPEQYVRVALNEVDAASVSLGNRAFLSFDALGGKTVEGKVVQVDTIGEVTQGVVTYTAEIDFSLDDDRLKPGMSANAEIILSEKKNVLIVPASALRNENGSSVVLLPGEGRQSKKKVETGISDEVSVEVLNGVVEGETIVTNIVMPLNSSSSPSSGFSLFRGVGGGQRSR